MWVGKDWSAWALRLASPYQTLSSTFSNGKAVEYNGGRTADTIVSWVEKKTGPPAVTLEDVDAAKKFIEDNKVAIVGFFKVRSST